MIKLDRLSGPLLALLVVAGRTALAAQPFSHGWDTPKVIL